MVKGKKQYIGQLEKVWAGSPYFTLRKRLANTRPIHFIDNTSAIAGLVKGYARPIDSAKIVHAVSAVCAAISCTPYYTYVRSDANIADLPSRHAIPELIDVLARLGWLQHTTWVEPALPALTSWRAEARMWMRWARLDAEPAPSLASLRGRWRHLVRRVPALGRTLPPGSVYVGRDPRFGRTRFGNLAATVRKSACSGHGGRAAEHERCVRQFATFLAHPARADLRRQVRQDLRGRLLLCHCKAGLPCHAEILAALANAPRATEAALCALCE